MKSSDDLVKEMGISRKSMENNYMDRGKFFIASWAIGFPKLKCKLSFVGKHYEKEIYIKQLLAAYIAALTKKELSSIT